MGYRRSMGWLRVTEPFAAVPRAATPAPQVRLTGRVDHDAGFVELTDVAASGELGLAGCEELVLVDSVFEGATLLSDGDMTIEARRCTFDKCDLSRLRFDSLRGSRICGAKLVGTDFSAARLDDVIFEDCTFRYANLRAARLERVAFLNCTLDDVDLFEAELIDVDFTGSSLQTVSVDRLKATRVDLRDASSLGLDAVGSLKGCLASETQLHELLYSLAFASGLGVEERDD